MSNFVEVASTITAEVYESFKLAVEIGKWPDGRKLSLEQKELCLQAMIAYELKHLPEEGEHCHDQGWRFEIVDMDGRKIDKLLVSAESK